MESRPLPGWSYRLNRLWIVVAHEAGARIFFRQSARERLIAGEQIDWPIGRAKAREINSERPGHEKSWSPSKQRHGFEPRLQPTEKNALDLAREIALRLDKAADLDEFDHLILVAGPKFLGLLRRELKPAAASRLAITWDQNLGNIDDQAIPLRLAPVLEAYERTRELKAPANG